MALWGEEVRERWPIGVVWFATFLVFLGTSYGTKSTYRSSMNAFNTIFSLFNIPSPFRRCTIGGAYIYGVGNDGLLQGGIHMSSGQVRCGGLVIAKWEFRPCD